MQKIDFYGGSHGNFLGLVVNVAINQNGYDISRPQFTPDGACHLKEKDSSYDKITVAQHYSYYNVPFGSADQVIRIVPNENDMLICITNSFLRAGDKKITIDDLEKDTINKLSLFKKGENFLKTIVDDHGHRVDYPRSVIRNYFYSMLSEYSNGLGMFVNFTPSSAQIHNFPFRAFFDIGNFYQELNEIAKFLNQDFFPTIELGKLHSDFINRNQGYLSEVKCKQVWSAILHGKPMNIKLNLVEEAWINVQIAKSFRCYDHPMMIQDEYPTNTLDISKAIFDWKSKDHR